MSSAQCPAWCLVGSRDRARAQRQPAQITWETCDRIRGRSALETQPALTRWEQRAPL